MALSGSKEAGEAHGLRGLCSQVLAGTALEKSIATPGKNVLEHLDMHFQVPCYNNTLSLVWKRLLKINENHDLSS